MISQNVYKLNYQDKELILIGTAHVSKNSAEQVKEIIDLEKPDSVCVELDKGRYHSIINKDKWKNTNIIKVIKEKKSSFLFVNILLSNYQKRMAKQFNINPGQEMVQGIESAKENNSQLILADRDIQITFKRIWRGLGFWGKIKLIFTIIMSMLDDEEITEEQLEEMKTEDLLNAALSEMSKVFPRLKKYLVDERDQYLANKIKQAPGRKIVAVLGAAHVPGIKKEIFKEQKLSELEKVPRKSFLSKSLGWIIPILVVALIISTFSLNKVSGIQQMKVWILWNGSLSALGAAFAFGHILSILTAFIIAPISSLNPLLAAGWFAGLTEAYIRKPKVEDFENLAEDLSSFKGLWKNRVTRVLMVVIFANLGSVIGTWLGGIEVIKLFLDSLA